MKNIYKVIENLKKDIMAYNPEFGFTNANEALNQIRKNGFNKNRLYETIKEFKKLNIKVERHESYKGPYNMYVCHGWWESTKTRRHGWRYESIEEILLSIYNFV